jgi:hypothetical protein
VAKAMPEVNNKKNTQKMQDIKALNLPVSKAVLLHLYFSEL